MTMHAKALIALSPAFLLAACGGSKTEPAPTDTATSATPTAAMADAPVAYDCLPAQRLSVAYDNSADPAKAALTLDGRTYDLTVGVSASGARYVTENGRTAGKTLVWWNKGQDGTLYEGTAGNPDAPETKIAECSPSVVAG
jgi:membrane-bound inhibitor of C-type lysozyme